MKKLISSYLYSENMFIYSLEVIFIIFLLSYFQISSVITLGGMMLILGAKYMNNGNMLFSTISYVGADWCWAINAWQHADMFGFITVNVGIIVGLSVLYRINKGIFVKSLKKSLGEENAKSRS